MRRYISCPISFGPGADLKSDIFTAAEESEEKNNFNHEETSAAEPQPSRSDSRKGAKGAKREMTLTDRDFEQEGTEIAEIIPRTLFDN
jgi:hypothetical protein